MSTEFPPSLPAPPLTEAELQVQELLRMMHVRSSKEAIKYAVASGAFSSVLLPKVFPLVLDANMLRGELLRTARTGRTILANAANNGSLRLFVAQHVVDEVWEHHAQWAVDGGMDSEVVRGAWELTFLPLLRCVPVPVGWTTAEESARLAVLEQPEPVGDPDDVPSATLALLLGAPLLSRDHKPLRAVYGEDFNTAHHKQWLDALKGGGDLGPLGQYMYASSWLVAGVGYAIVGGLRALARRWSWASVLTTAAGGIALAGMMLDQSTRGRLRQGFGQPLSSGFELLMGLVAAHNRAEAQFRTLAAPSPSVDHILRELSPEAALGRLCLHELARSPASVLSPDQLHDRLSAQFTVPHGVAAVAQQLRNWSCFEEVDDQYQVGHPLVRSADQQIPEAGG